MEDLMVTLWVVVLFLIRIGIPVLILVTLGVLFDHWQQKREHRI